MKSLFLERGMCVAQGDSQATSLPAISPAEFSGGVFLPLKRVEVAAE